MASSPNDVVVELADERCVLKAVMERSKQLARLQETGLDDDEIRAGSSLEESTTPGLVTRGRPNRLFALLIGVDDYQGDGYRSLRGAVKDAHNVEAFLLSQNPPVRAERIKILTNEQATEANIIASIRSFWRHVCDSKARCTCAVENVRRDDPILIFYAGHGCSLPKPDGWPTASSHIQALAPYDARVENGVVKGVIPDRVFGALLRELANNKGDNITVVLDCCHSGSGTRDSDSIPRGIEFKSYRPGEDEVIYHTIDPSYQKEIWGADNCQDRSLRSIERGVGGKVDPSAFANGSLQSHVLLAACSPDQSAYEDCVVHGGRFTSALLALLKQPTAGAMTYSELIKRLDKLPLQTPQCEGRDSGTRLIFDTGLVQRIRDCYNVVESVPSYHLRAGRKDGVRERDVLAVYPDERTWSSQTTPLLNLVVDATNQFTSSVLPIGNPRSDILDKYPNAVAVLARTKTTTGSCVDARRPYCVSSAIIKSTHTLYAGRIHGIIEGDVFAVYEHKDAYISASPPSGRLMVNFVNATTSALSPHGCSNLTVSDTAAKSVAILDHASARKPFGVHVDAQEHPQLCELVALALAKESLDPAGRFGSCLMLTPLEEACLSIVPADNDTVDLVILDTRVRMLGSEKLNGTIVREVASLRAALRSAAHFFYYLDSSPEKQKHKTDVSVRMWQMIDSIDYHASGSSHVPIPVYRPIIEVDDFQTSGVLKPAVSQTEDGAVYLYGMDISLVRKAKCDLFVWLFYFNCGTLGINQYYSPPIVRDGNGTAPLRVDAREPLPLNYGDAGHAPFIFKLPTGICREVGFLRLFLSTHYTDLAEIQQAPIVDSGRGCSPVLTSKPAVEGWDALTFAVVLTRDETGVDQGWSDSD
ncbi:unnamed protein product [Peniophora sp. CBMAI 1063]|nr:unnamed protein product [Peniophora sp. CBMAI 1063]